MSILATFWRSFLWFVLFLSWAEVVALSTRTVVKPTPSQPQQWFPRRIQDVVNYDEHVQSLYLRHIVTETYAVASDALKLCYGSKEQSQGSLDDVDEDPFASTASSISACLDTRGEGGKIGWVERGFESSFLSNAVVEELYRRHPKAGDIVILPDESRDLWHVIQVSEVWIDREKLFANKTAADTVQFGEAQMVGSFHGVNQVRSSRRKLKGQGWHAAVPSTISSYSIQTNGCQMNVADSERLAGILHHELHMTEASTPTSADVVLFNTCSIRDRAEQKLYNALGPFAAAKRKGKAQAIIVTGCVAQQEGEALLKRIPELDAVIGT